MASIVSLNLVPGDDLFRKAAEYYGNAAGWTLIARANGLYDPYIQVAQIISIPQYNRNRVNDGVLDT